MHPVRPGGTATTDSCSPWVPLWFLSLCKGSRHRGDGLLPTHCGGVAAPGGRASLPSAAVTTEERTLTEDDPFASGLLPSPLHERDSRRERREPSRFYPFALLDRRESSRRLAWCASREGYRDRERRSFVSVIFTDPRALDRCSFSSHDPLGFLGRSPWESLVASGSGSFDPWPAVQDRRCFPTSSRHCAGCWTSAGTQHLSSSRMVPARCGDIERASVMNHARPENLE